MITITQAATNTASSDTLTVSADNGGTQILDSTGAHCSNKTNYRGDPREWGAVGDGATDDTKAIQNWLGAFGVGVSKAVHTPPPNFGPWIAALPGNYYVAAPLICPANAVLQGFANDTIGVSNTQGTGNPTVTIFAGANFTSGTALMTTGPYCRISGIALDAKGVTSPASTNPGNLINTVDVAGTHTVIDAHALIQNGYYGVNCPATGAPNLDGMQVKDAEIYNTQDAGILVGSGCENVRLNDDIVDITGLDGTGAGVQASSSDITIADGIIEGAGGPGLLLSNATYAVVSGMTFSGNNIKVAASAQAPTIEVANSTDITLTGNRVQGGGPNTSAPGPSDSAISSGVLLAGTVDNLTLSGNVYSAKNGGHDANVKPLYIYDVSTSSPPTLTNTHFYETPAQPAVSVFASTAAQALLAPLQIPQFTNNQLSGLTLSNDTGNTQAIDIAPGSAADSTNSTLISLPASCGVNLAKSANGPGGLDSGAVHINTTYFIFLIAAAGANPGTAAPTPSCMASTSLTPAFTASAFANTGYQVAATGGTYTGGTGTTVYNANPLAGVIAGDAIMSTDSSLNSGTTISGFSANAGPPLTSPPTGTLTPGMTSIASVPSLTGIQEGMAVLDTTKGCIPGGTVVQSFSGTGPYTITISHAVQSGGNCGTAAYTATLSVSGARQLTLSQSAALTEYNAPLVISTGYYRLVGAVYTDGNASHPNVVPFKQDGDTFTLATTAPFGVTNPPGLGTSSTAVPIASVPSQIAVQAFGRCVATSAVTLSAGNVTAHTPSTMFIATPGYMVNSAAPNTPFPFSLTTVGGSGPAPSGSINAASDSTGGTTILTCYNDGWVFHRAQ